MTEIRRDMERELLAGLRRSCLLMAVFAASFVMMYAGVVLLTKFLYIYFQGFTPEFSEHLLRAIFYGLSALTIAVSVSVSRRRYSKEGLKGKTSDIDALVRHLVLTPVISMAFAEAVLIFGFFLFFLSAMYVDFSLLAAVSFIMILWSVPSVGFLEDSLKKARE
ncbi:MAG: hypothetical protein A2V21_309635 [Deltaproteobacteria bacterium GWC2_55_46]|nr:MAG: hypothetical protein A2V21_309635 [Deltaproteobacteria bacterium GWC2_55_46]